MANYTLNITEDYVVPEGVLTKAQYVDFVMNKAAESYRNQYSTADKEAGIQAACDAYNAAIPAPAPVDPPPAE